MAKSLPSFPTFDLSEDQTSIGQRWNKWVRKFENFLSAMNIADDARKKSMLLHYSGDDVYDVYETLTITPLEITAAQGANPAVMETEYQAIVRALSAKSSPRKTLTSKFSPSVRKNSVKTKLLTHFAQDFII
jgi:hypothetical protein